MVFRCCLKASSKLNGFSLKERRFIWQEARDDSQEALAGEVDAALEGVPDSGDGATVEVGPRRDLATEVVQAGNVDERLNSVAARVDAAKEAEKMAPIVDRWIQEASEGEPVKVDLSGLAARSQEPLFAEYVLRFANSATRAALFKGEESGVFQIDYSIFEGDDPIKKTGLPIYLDEGQWYLVDDTGFDQDLKCGPGEFEKCLTNTDDDYNLLFYMASKPWNRWIGPGSKEKAMVQANELATFAAYYRLINVEVGVQHLPLDVTGHLDTDYQRRAMKMVYDRGESILDEIKSSADSGAWVQLSAASIRASESLNVSGMQYYKLRVVDGKIYAVKLNGAPAELQDSMVFDIAKGDPPKKDEYPKPKHLVGLWLKYNWRPVGSDDLKQALGVAASSALVAGTLTDSEKALLPPALVKEKEKEEAKANGVDSSPEALTEDIITKPLDYTIALGETFAAFGTKLQDDLVKLIKRKHARDIRKAGISETAIVDAALKRVKDLETHFIAQRKALGVTDQAGAKVVVEIDKDYKLDVQFKTGNKIIRGLTESVKEGVSKAASLANQALEKIPFLGMLASFGFGYKKEDLIAHFTHLLTGGKEGKEIEGMGFLCSVFGVGKENKGVATAKAKFPVIGGFIASITKFGNSIAEKMGFKPDAPEAVGIAAAELKALTSGTPLEIDRQLEPDVAALCDAQRIYFRVPAGKVWDGWDKKKIVKARKSGEAGEFQSVALVDPRGYDIIFSKESVGNDGVTVPAGVSMRMKLLDDLQDAVAAGTSDTDVEPSVSDAASEQSGTGPSEIETPSSSSEG